MLEADQEARRRIREELDRSFFVEAAAGTGKTTELVQRVVASIASGEARVEETVVVTFTRKAAGEIKLRLRQSLEQARGHAARASEISRRLEAAIARLEDARVGTIHAFAGELLRERPVEARLDPEFVALDEAEALELFRRVFLDWFQARLFETPPGLRRALSREPPKFSRERGPLDRLVNAAWQIASFRDFDAPWPVVPWDRDAALQALVLGAKALILDFDRAARPRDPLVVSLEPLRRVLDWADRASAEQALDLDVLEGLLVAAHADLRFAREKRGQGPFLQDSLASRGDACLRRDQLLEEVQAFVERANTDLVTRLRNELYEVVRSYQRRKAELGKLDFTDLLLETRNLLVERAEVRAAFQARWSRIYVDEVQDTDPLQMEILLLLSADDPRVSSWQEVHPRPGKLFMVGDPKQSIYGFRRADLGLYQTVKSRLQGRGVDVLTLSRSFRATAPLQGFINHCFSPVMKEDHERGQPAYVPLEGGPPGPEGRPSVVVLPVPDPEGLSRQSRSRVARALPDLVAAWLYWLLFESGWTVRDPARDGAPTPIRPRHVALLFRRYAQGELDTTAPYLRALEARGLPHLVVGARAFHDQEEVETLRAALIAIEWPDDELAVFATLHGPLFAISDEALFRYRKTVGELHPLALVHAALSPELEPVHEALSLLGEFHHQRNLRPFMETITLLLEKTRAHAGFAMRPAGARVLSNLHRLLELAGTFEQRGGLSFRGFVERLEEGAEYAQSVEAPVVEESAEGVRVITAHSAKGLEFPVVILADLDGGSARRNPARHLDPDTRTAALRLLGYAPEILKTHAPLEAAREEAEELRLAYVAASRARDLLVVPAIETAPFPSWFAALNAGLYPKDRTCNEAEVVWWETSGLSLDVPGRFGLRAQDVLREHPSVVAETPDPDRGKHEQWLARRARAVAVGAAPSLRPFIATSAEALAPGASIAIELETVPRALDRPSGPCFGTLVHTVLRDVDLGAPGGDVLRLAELQGRILGAPRAEIEAAARAVEAALAHPVMRAAHRSAYLERELPVMLHNPDGSILEGEIDLVFEDEVGQLVVVDFKTDQDPSLRREKYERQLSWYAAALRAETDRPIRALILVL